GPLSRRTLLRRASAAAALGAGGPGRLAARDDPIAAYRCQSAPPAATQRAEAGPLRPLRLAWNATAICTAAAPVARER
ncbi:hypothetical protein ABTL60_20015, partial [Acinetobacter baumannii]